MYEAEWVDCWVDMWMVGWMMYDVVCMYGVVWMDWVDGCMDGLLYVCMYGQWCMRMYVWVMLGECVRMH